MIDRKLLDTLGAAEESERRYAAHEIGEWVDHRVADALLAQLRVEPSRAVKDAILRSLSRVWYSGSTDSMIELLKDSDPFVRAEAAQMLQSRADAVVESLRLLVTSEDRDLRKFSVDILGRFSVGVPDHLYLLALKDKDVNVVISTIENIGSGRRKALAEHVAAIAIETSQPMAVCACLETLASIGTRQTLGLLRVKFPSAAEVPGLYLQPFFKLLGGTAGVEAFEEICSTIALKGTSVHEVAIDALAKISARHHPTELPGYCQGVLLGLLTPELDPGVCFHLIRLLGHFTASSRVALAVLPYIHDRDRPLGLAAVDSLTRSSEPAVEQSLHSLLSTETDPEIRAELDDILGRRPRWNLQPTSSPS